MVALARPGSGGKGCSPEWWWSWTPETTSSRHCRWCRWRERRLPRNRRQRGSTVMGPITPRLHITSYGVVQSQTWVVFDGREFCPLREELSRLQAIGKLRCPRCLHGAVFESLWKMHRFCPFCRLEYEREQGYFLGAMYFGYGMALALSVPLVLVLLVFGGFSVNEVILTLGVTITFLSPLLFRYSRILWMHFDQFWDPR